MKTLLIFTAALWLLVIHPTRAEEAPPGCCAGGYRPAKNCKTCEHCWYCGTKAGRYKGARPQNSGKCIVCAPDLFPVEPKKGSK